MDVVLKFDKELNDFLSVRRRGQPIQASIAMRRSLKDLIESFGVPHSEVDHVTLHGETTELERIVQVGDEINVYPYDPEREIGLLNRSWLTSPRFIADDNVSRLARILRALGFDVIQDWGLHDEGIVLRAKDEQRIILTRDQGLLRRKLVVVGFYVRESDAYLQAKELIRKLRLHSHIKPLSRCLTCNCLLRPMTEREIDNHTHIPALIRAEHAEYMTCDICHKAFWEGSHFEDMKERLGTLIQLS